jgi:hypothetical protein
MERPGEAKTDVVESVQNGEIEAGDILSLTQTVDLLMDAGAEGRFGTAMSHARTICEKTQNGEYPENLRHGAIDLSRLLGSAIDGDWEDGFFESGIDLFNYLSRINKGLTELKDSFIEAHNE